jgi:hypothetical protein
MSLSGMIIVKSNALGSLLWPFGGMRNAKCEKKPKPMIKNSPCTISFLSFIDGYGASTNPASDEEIEK